jgi:hypothetical protein
MEKGQGTEGVEAMPNFRVVRSKVMARFTSLPRILTL